MAALEVAEMNKVVRDVYGNPNKQNRSALSPEQIHRYVDGVIYNLADAPEKGLLLEFLLKLLVFDVDVQAQFIVNRGLLDQIERLGLPPTDADANRKKSLILYVVRKLLGKDVVQFGDDFIFELKKANQKLLALVIGPDELPASSAYLYHKYLSSVLDVVEVKNQAIQTSLQEVLVNERAVKSSIEALRTEVSPLPVDINRAQAKADAVEKQLATLLEQQDDKLETIRKSLKDLAVTTGKQVDQVTGSIKATNGKVAELEGSLAQHQKDTRANFVQLNQRLDSLAAAQIEGQKRLEELITSLERRLKEEVDKVASEVSVVKKSLDVQQQQITTVIQTTLPAIQQQVSVDLDAKLRTLTHELEAVKVDLQGTREVVLGLADQEADAAAAKKQTWEQAAYKLGGSRR